MNSSMRRCANCWLVDECDPVIRAAACVRIELPTIRSIREPMSGSAYYCALDYIPAMKAYMVAPRFDPNIHTRSMGSASAMER